MNGLIAAALAASLAATKAPPPRTPDVFFQFTLSDNVEEHWTSFSALTYDPVHDELYAATGDTVAVYKEGFETFRFTTDPRIGGVYGVAPLEDGALLVLSSSGALFRCNFRGKFLAQVPLTGLTDSMGAIRPDRIQLARGRVYLADSIRMKVVEVSPEGKVLSFRDLAPLVVDPKQKKQRDYWISGFGVDEAGNLLFTIPTAFAVYVVSPEGEVKSFGQSGSREGRFNIVGAIARDDSGMFYVADVLRCVVILFDKDFTYLRELGGRGYAPGRLIAPSAVVVGNHWLFVSQGGNRGVNAYRVF